MKNKNSLIVAIFLLIVSSGVQAAQTADASADQSQSDAQQDAIEQTVVGTLPYEVVVRSRISRRGLRELIQRVEDDFFDKFNELNIDDYYDVICYKHTPTMSHISERICEPRFIMETRNLNASEVTMLIGNVGKWTAGSAKSAFAFTPRTLHREKRSDYEILQEKMEELTSADSEFRSIGNALAELKARLENYESE